MGRQSRRECRADGGRRGEEWRGCTESDPDSDPHIHSTVYSLSKQADYTESQYTGWKRDGGGDRGQERERPDVNRGLDRKRILNNMDLDCLKPLKKKDVVVMVQVNFQESK